MYYIYKIENLINNKKYIGLTNNISRRRARHFTDLKCNRHDNSFLQKEFNIYGKENFSFEIIFSGEVTSDEISLKEAEYIKFYDSYKNGYNQNEGGSFGPSNGGTHLIQSDIFNILSALEFCSRPGGVLSNMYNVSLTTISRIKKGENHCQYKKEYEKMSIEQRKEIYKIFCESSNFDIIKKKQTIIKTNRRLNKEQVFMILANYEFHIVTLKYLKNKFSISSDYTFSCIKNGVSYKDYKYEYDNLNNVEKENIVSLLRN